MTSATWQALAQLCAERLLNSIPEGLAIAGVAWLLLRLAGKRNSGTRFAVWFSALLVVAVVPFLHSSMGKGVAHVAGPEIVLPGMWATAILAVWILATALAGARVAVGLLNLRRLRRSTVAISASDLHPLVRETIERESREPLLLARRVAICSSSAVRVPTAIGFFKPMIVIPDWALRELPAEELKVILLHEFAHLRRWDDWTNLAQKLVRTIFFFHPAVWWIENRLSLEREMACDDAVLAETRNPQRYAECLVSLAEKSFMRRGTALTQAVVSRARETALRLAQILDGDRPRGTRAFRPALGIMAALAALCLGVLHYSPRLVAFETTPVAGFTLANQISGDRLPANDAAPSAGGAVVPVAARFDAGSKINGRRRKLTPAPVAGSVNLTHLVTAKQRSSRPRPTLMPRAVTERAIQSPQLFVVMQTTQYDERGSAISTLSVWHVTFATGERSGIPAAVIVKLI